MRKLVAALVGLVVLAAAGFAAASIVHGGSLVDVLSPGDSTTVGSTTGSVTTGTTPERRVTICHITGSKKHPAHTITVDQHAVPAHLAHGDHLGPCTGTEKPRPHGASAGSNAKEKGKPAHPNSGSKGKAKGKTKSKGKPTTTPNGKTNPGQGNGQGNGKDHGKPGGNANSGNGSGGKGHAHGNGGHHGKRK